MYKKRNYFKKLTIISLLIAISIFINSNLGFSFDEAFNLYPTFLIIKEEYPEFLARLKDGWINKTDTDLQKEEKLGMFFQDLDNDLKSKGLLNELNFNDTMSTSFKTVIGKSKHRDLFRTLLTSFSEEVDYMDKTGRLHPNLYPIRDAVKKSLLTRSVIEILPLNNIKTKHYTEIDKLNLPKNVDIKTSNDTIESIPIKWDLADSKYDSQVVGQYILRAYLDLTKYEYIVPTEEIVTIKVESMPYIENIEISKIGIEFGGEFNKAMLGKEVLAKLSDGSIKTISNIVWDTNALDYDTYMPGSYDISGQAYIDDSSIYYESNRLDIRCLLEIKKPNKMPSGGRTIIFDNIAYYLKDIDKDNILKSKIEKMISENDKILVKLSDHIFIDKEGNLYNIEEIPRISYYFNSEIIGIYEEKDGQLIE